MQCQCIEEVFLVDLRVFNFRSGLNISGMTYSDF